MTLPPAAANLAGFAHLLRSAGNRIAPEQAIGFIEAVGLLGPRSMDDIREAALATLAIEPDRIAEFDTLFRAWFWGDAAFGAAGDEDEDETRMTDDGGARHERPLPQEQATAGERAATEERLAERRFPAGSDALARFGRQLPDALPTRRSLRWATARRGRPDLRRSMRRMVETEGDIPSPLQRRRPKVQRKLLLLVDISGSMKLHTAGHLAIAHAVVTRADRAEVFTLGTRLTRITTALRARDRGLALARVAETVEDWAGGTRIGPTLLALLSVPRFSAFARGAAIVVLTDGLERQGHAEMVQAFARLNARGHRLSLLTPLAADPRFRPRTAALAAVLPFLDDLADGSGIRPVADFILSLAKPAPRARDLWREAS